jgi:hypothetical protein
MASLPQPQSSGLQLFGDFGTAGGEDIAPNPLQDNQICWNFYAEVNKQNAKEILGLIACPGLVQVAAGPGGGAPAFTSSTTAWAPPSTVTNLPVRGMYALPGEQLALVVIANVLYLMTSGFVLTKAGTLLTSTGPVVMVANNGAQYGVTGTVVGTVAIVDGPNGYYYNYLTGSFARIVDPSFLGADRVVCIDGWFVFNQPGTQAFYTPIQPYGIVFGSFFALKDGAPDNLVTIFANKEMLWLVGEETTEVWYNAGGQFFPFQRLVGTLMQTGCQAKHSISRFTSEGTDGVIWFGRSERGSNQMIRTRGFSTDTVSTPAFSAEVATYAVTSDAIGYTYQEDTHEFYVLTFPTADVTWVYDSQSGYLHKRPSYDPFAQQTHRHRSNCFMNFAGMRLVGDYQCGAIFQLTRKAYTDAGWPLLAKRRSPHIWDKGPRGRVFMASLQLDFATGQGNASGLGTAPVANLSISRDGGKTFGQKWPATMGAQGQFRSRTMWRRLGFGRDNVVDLEVIDPVPRDLVGATLKAFSSAA